jgi:hypothetical protein
MSEPLDDFNRRTTAGSGSWMMGPAKNAAESAAQSFIDAQQRGSGTATGGGSIDFGAKICAVMVLIGIALFSGGAHALENMKEGGAIMGIVVLIVSGFLILIGGGGLAVACFKGLGSARGWISLLLAALAGLAAWWFSPWLWFIGLSLPQGLAALAAVALVLFFTG